MAIERCSRPTVLPDRKAAPARSHVCSGTGTASTGPWVQHSSPQVTPRARRLLSMPASPADSDAPGRRYEEGSLVLHSRGRNDPVRGRAWESHHGPTPRRTRPPPMPTPPKPSPARAGFMRSALAILGETGRTDFTVLEVVERSKTSLRSFYQHFSTKDELLLALIDRIMAESTEHVARPKPTALTAADRAAPADRTDQRARRVEHPGQHQPRPDLLQRPPAGDPAAASSPGCSRRCTS